MSKTDNFYKTIIENLINPFAYQKIVFEEKDIPVDFEFIEVNKMFEDVIGLKTKDIIGRRYMDVFPGSSQVKKSWVEFVGEVAIGGGRRETEYYSSATNKWYQVDVYSYERGYFMTIYNEISILKKIEERINDTENKYKKLVETAQEGIAITNKNETITFANKRFGEMLGYSVSELIGKQAAEVMFNEDVKDMVEIHQQRIQGISSRYEARFKHKKGSEIWALASGSPNYDKDGNFKESFAMFIDITEKKKAEEELKLSEKKFRSYFECSPNPILITDGKGKILQVNPASRRITGYSEEEALSMYIFDYIPEKELEYAINEFSRLVKGGFSNSQTSIKTKNGREIPIVIDGVKLSEDKYIGFWKDLREIKKTEEQLRISEKKFHLYFDNLPNPVFVFTKVGKILATNNASIKVSGYEREELINSSIFDFISETNMDKTVEDFNKMLKIGSYNTELLMRNKKGEEILIEINTERLTGTEYICFWKDITELRKTKRDLKEYENKLSLFFDVVPYDIVVLDNEGKILKASKSCAEKTGYTVTELLQMPVYNLISHKNMDLIKKFVLKKIKKGEIKHEVIGRSKNGEELFVLVEGQRMNEKELIVYVRENYEL